MNRLTRSLRYLLPGLALIAITGAQAANEPLPPAVDVLTEFYEEMDGDNWRNNDGWLDPEVDHCDWFGVSCGFDSVNLFLQSNNLSGDLNQTDILRLVQKISLSDNQVRGTVPFFGSRLETVDLSHNLLDGKLPEVSGRAGQNLFELDLANNEFSGEVPGSWEQLVLSDLDLSNNELTGTAEGAFAAMQTDDPSSIFLADNPFAGELPPSLAGRELFINLCWTGFEINDSDLADWVAENHVGGPDFDIESCTKRERAPIDLGLSGSWFNPERDGEGLSLMLLDNGAPLVYWFTHISKGRQMWLVKTGETDGPTLTFPRWLRTRGRFGEGFGDAENPVGGAGTLRLNHVQGDVLHGQYLVIYSNRDLEQEGEPTFGTTVPRPTRFIRDHVRLSQLAGTTCENQRDNQWMSGAWFNPEREGEGFIVEVLEDGRGVVYWFTYTPDGEEQAWMTGVGEFEGNTLHIDNLVQPRDTGEGMPFDPSGIENMAWGTLTMEFNSDQSGHASFDSDLEDYGSDDFSIQRLARPMLADCGEN
jgi:hypothetical protein